MLGARDLSFVCRSFALIWRRPSDICGSRIGFGCLACFFHVALMLFACCVPLPARWHVGSNVRMLKWKWLCCVQSWFACAKAVAVNCMVGFSLHLAHVHVNAHVG